MVKCFNGMANAACAVLDAMNHEGVVGTLAGDDTIFCLVKHEEHIEAVIDQFKTILGA